MELLLNLLWMMLAVPAFLVWQRKQRSLDGRRAHCLLALGCVLVLLFPVISATDDLHPLRAEMEESSPSKRIVKQAAGATFAVWCPAGGTPLVAVGTSCFKPANDEIGRLAEFTPAVFAEMTADTMACRPPPTLI